MIAHILNARLSIVLLALAGLALPVATAHADEIHIVDLKTGEKSKLRVAEVTSETWTEVKFRDRAKSRREKSVPTNTVQDIVRSARGKDVQTLERGMADLRRGNYREAAIAFQNVSGGGYRKDAGTGERTYTSFSANDPESKRKRPSWTSEYAHYHYAKALLERAKAENSKSLFTEVLMALEDRKLDPIVDDEGKERPHSTGGFLTRFEGGNSRFYPHAMLAKAEAHVGLGEFAAAQKMYAELAAEADKVKLGPRWLYEGLIGKGVIAAAQGSTKDAELAFNGAGAIMLRRLTQEQNVVWMRDYGRLYSRARTRVAEAQLKDAERRNARQAFVELRHYIQAGSPEALRQKHAGMGTKQLNALVAGARDAEAQSVGLNGTGLAFLAENNYDEALLAFKSVAVKYYGNPDQTARAYFYIAKAADQAAKKAKNGEAKEMYENMKKEARRTLRTQFRDTSWAKK